jgi:hypothetical protein
MANGVLNEDAATNHGPTTRSKANFQEVLDLQST